MAQLFSLGRQAHTTMNTPQDATLEISYPKALLVSAVGFACFFVAMFVMGIPTSDPLLIGFLIFMGIVMPFVFAGCLCFMLRCKIGRDGLRRGADILSASASLGGHFGSVGIWQPILFCEMSSLRWAVSFATLVSPEASR